MEIPQRLTPTSSVARDLYLRSGNRCAFPGCSQPLMTQGGILVGEIAHIEAALASGPRFRASMTNEERRAFGNLLLMCGTHHTVIDKDLDTWTVEHLIELKKAHEAIYTGAVDRLRSTVGDITEGTKWRSASNLGRLPAGDFDLSPEEIAASIEIINKFAERLATLPLGARSVLALIVSRGDETGWAGDHEVAIPVPLLEHIADCSRQELYDHISILEHAELVDYSDEYDEPPKFYARNSSPTMGWKIMADLRRIANNNPSIVRQALVELDFTVFDA
jgi:hypothetical protein